MYHTIRDVFQIMFVVDEALAAANQKEKRSEFRQLAVSLESAVKRECGISVATAMNTKQRETLIGPEAEVLYSRILEIHRKCLRIVVR